MSKVESIATAPAPKVRALQDVFLSAAIQQRTPVVAYLRNGVKLEGRIVGFDAFQVLIEGRGAVQLLYKSALATVVALSSLNLHEDGGPPGDRSAAAKAPRRPPSGPRHGTKRNLR